MGTNLMSLMSRTGGGFSKFGAGTTLINTWSNPYVTNGLIAMWDGEWNAGGGVHDASATTWKDLSGNNYDISSSLLGWSEDETSMVISSNANITMPSALTSYLNSHFHTDGISFYANYDIETPVYGYGIFDLRTDGTDGIFSVRSDNYGSTTSQIMYWMPRTGNQRILLGENTVPYRNLSIALASSTSTSMGYYNNTLVGNRPYGTEATTYVGDIATFNLIAATTMPIRRLLIYGKQLSAAEVAANYAIDQQRFNLT